MQEKYRMINTDIIEGEDIGIREKTAMKSNPEKFKSTYISKSKNGIYDCFAISYLFRDLFCGNKYTRLFSNTPLIQLSDIPRGHKEMLAFLLPAEIIDKVMEKEAHYSGDENHIAHFFQLKYNDNVISNYLSEINAELGWKEFINLIQEHICHQLKDIKSYDNPDLIEYLSIVGNKTIVPRQKSSKANDEFSSLIDRAKNGSVQALSLIIANFFISCFLGLKSMNYSKEYGNKGKYPSLKTYLLSNTGMECIWLPDLITPPYEHLYDPRKLYENASYENAIKTCEQWLGKYEAVASNEAKALAYRILGLSLCSLASDQHNGNFDRKSEGIDYLEKCIILDESDYSVSYALYEYLIEEDDSRERALKHLKTAFAHNYAKAVIEVAFSYFNNQSIINDISEKDLLNKINYIISHERQNDANDVGTCLYLHGKFEKKHGNESRAAEDFKSAAKRGNIKARQEINRTKRNERISFPSFINDKYAPCCYANSFTGNNYSVISTFPSDVWTMYTSDKTDKEDICEVQNIDCFIELNCKTEASHSKLVFLLMSEDEEKNLNECLILLDKLYNIVIDIPKESRWDFIDSVDIFVSAKYETASMLIDANVSDMGDDIYFKVHITDEDRDTVHKLLCDAPLFLPALKADNTSTEIVLIGSSEMNYTFIKESIACAYLGKKYPINITLLGVNAKALENRFHQECPGIYNNTPHISCIVPKFINCNIKELDFPNYIYGGKCDSVLGGACENTFDIEMVNTFLKANYFVVDYADDLKNIRFATELRTWLMRSRGTFKRAPFIAVKCSDERNSYLASHLTLSGQPAGNSYFNQYDLFPIGVSAQTYCYENIINNPVLNDFALRIHKTYYCNNERAAENAFYSYSYNADSSLSIAIGLCYRFFAAGIPFNDKDAYLNFGFYKTPGIESQFNKQYMEKQEILASLEQSRWNGFMLSRGWESASKNEVQTYKEQLAGLSHKHVLAKKHPFIREWEDLDALKIAELLDILKSKFNYDQQPQSVTRKNIEDTAKYFLTPEKRAEMVY